MANFVISSLVRTGVLFSLYFRCSLKLYLRQPKDKPKTSKIHSILDYVHIFEQKSIEVKWFLLVNWNTLYKNGRLWKDSIGQLVNKWDSEGELAAPICSREESCWAELMERLSREVNF